jgi:hypothetical protein
MSGVFIESVSIMSCRSDFPSSELKKELESLSGQKFRRINRYILLGLCGVFRLPNIGSIDPSASLYIGTKNGCITETVSMLGQIYRDALLPMPFTFIGSSTNMVSYHVARSLRITGGNYTLSHRFSPLEVALEMGYRDMASQKTDSALIGCVDEAALPLEAFKKVVGMEGIEHQLEGGCWLRLGRKSQHAIAEIIDVKRFTTLEEVQESLGTEVTLILDDSFDAGGMGTYVGSNSALILVEMLSTLKEGMIAIAIGMGSRQISLMRIKILRK